MISLVSKKNYLNYLRSDDLIFFKYLRKQKKFKNTSTSKILLKSSVKRYIFFKMYRELIISKKKMKVLDIGGSLHLLTPILAKKHDYSLCNIFNNKRIDKNALPMNLKVYNSDWFDLPKFKKNNFDLIISNDLFPNVDQRLDLFLKRFKKSTRSLKISLTSYNDKLLKFYQAKRIEKGEILTLLPYNQEYIYNILKKNKIGKINNLNKNTQSLFKNGRVVYILDFKEK